MEEQPKDRAHEKRYYHHGEEKTAIRPKKYLKDVHCHCQFKHQETQTKKTGNGKVNCTNIGDKTQSEDDSTGIPSSPYINGKRHLIDTNLKLKPAAKVSTNQLKVGSKDVSDHTNSMDGKNDKASDFKHHEVKLLDKKESVLSLNGVVPLNSGYITNGYSSKTAADNDGSGSESGYTTPKKRKARRNSIKGAENMTREKDKATQRGNMASSKQELEPSSPDASERAVSSRPDGRRPGAAETLPMVELQRKNSDGRTSGKIGKAKVASKEDSWTLFKPPPVFPVDNSSAKTVPKISYASKVKENLNKAALAGGDTPSSQVLGRLSQVPMSAVKTIASASFANGPVSGDGNGCLSVGTFFSSAASSAPPAASNPGGENVASSPDNDGSSPAAPEPRKSSLFVYPLNPLNMQPALPSARHADTPAAQTNQKALGDIFQNQWGLSFINEPNAGPEGAAGRLSVDVKVAEVTFQGESCGSLTPPGLAVTPSTPEQGKRTSTPSSVSKAWPPAPAVSEGGPQVQPSGQVQQKGEARSPGAVVSASCNDLTAEPALAPLTNTVLGLSKAQAHTKGLDRTCSWGSFDLKAAVLYHTKEFEYVFTLQKQDPKRVVFYDETKEGPDQ